MFDAQENPTQSQYNQDLLQTTALILNCSNTAMLKFYPNRVSFPCKQSLLIVSNRTTEMHLSNLITYHQWIVSFPCKYSLLIVSNRTTGMHQSNWIAYNQWKTSLYLDRLQFLHISLPFRHKLYESLLVKSRFSHFQAGLYQFNYQ